MVFIFANFRFADPDIKTLHTASRVHNQNRDAVVFIELVDPAGELLKHAPEDFIVLPSRRAMELVLHHTPVNPLEWVEPEQRAGIVERLARPGVRCQAIYDACDQHLKQQRGSGLAHHLGHGVGLEIHEEPFLGPSRTGKLEDRVPITVEPGVYLPGRGGVRIEDTLVVRDTAPELLTLTTKELVEV